MKTVKKTGIIIILLFIVMFLNPNYALDINSLDPEFEIQLDTDYRVETFDAYLKNSGSFYNLTFSEDEQINGNFLFELEDLDYVNEGNYDFVLRYLDFDNRLREKFVNLNIEREELELTIKQDNNINYFQETNEKKYILVNNKDSELTINSNVPISKYKYEIFNYEYCESNSCELSEMITENSNKKSINIDLSNTFSDLEDTEKKILKIKVYDQYEIEYIKVLTYIIIADEIAPDFDLNYGENEIYDTMFDLRINASEEVVCKYEYNYDSEKDFDSDFSKEKNYIITGLIEKDEYDFEVICKDFVGNEQTKEFTISVDPQEENKILSILPNKYLGKDLKFTISTNRDSTCYYNLSGYQEELKKISGISKMHEVILSSYDDIGVKEEIFVNVFCSFSISTKGASDSKTVKFKLDFDSPTVLIKAEDTYEDIIYVDIEAFDNEKIQNCIITFEDVEYSCSSLGIDVDDNQINGSYSFKHKLENQQNYEIWITIKDGAGNIIESSDIFMKDLSNMPEELSTCSDGVKNQGESDIDCGGPCLKCELGSYCDENNDCEESADCINGRCVLNHCYNNLFDLDFETGLDCGDECSKKGLYCAVDTNCEEDYDCETGYCDKNTSLCKLPTCDDGVKNQDESDIDCGGICINENKTCNIGSFCNIDTDCKTGVCSKTDNKCSEYTKTQVKAEQEVAEEEAKSLGYKERNPLAPFLYIAIGFVVLVLSSLGYYSYSHREKNNFGSHNSFDQSRQKRQQPRVGNSFANINSANKEFINDIRKRNTNVSQTTNDNISLKNLNKIDVGSLENKLNRQKELDKKNSSSSNHLSNLSNIDTSKLKSSDIKQTIDKLKSRKINIKNMNLSKGSLSNISKEELLNQLKNKTKNISDIKIKNKKNPTKEDIEEMKNSSKKQEAKKEIEKIIDSKNKEKSKDEVLSKEIADLLDLKSEEEPEKKSTKESLSKSDSHDKLKNKNKNDIFDALENDLEDDDIYDEIDKI